MKFFHISDMHLGKRFKGVSFINDQKFVLDQILKQADILKPDCVVIAGDVYDKSIPSVEAVELLDDFLTKLSEKSINILMISGNHDSGERLGFAEKILRGFGIYIVSVFDGKMKRITLNDDFGEFDFFLCPYFRPSQVKAIYPERKIENSNDAVKVILEETDVRRNVRNTAVIHQFAAPVGKKIEYSDSEIQTVGGLDVIDTGLFSDFDYTAMGHIHKPQSMGEKIRYCGTPMKYSFSEANQEKSITVVEINEKGKTDISFVPLLPLHDMRNVKGTFSQILAEAEKEPSDDYINAVITGNEIICDPVGKLRQYYKNLLQIEFRKENSDKKTEYSEEFIKKSVYELFEDFFTLQNGKEMSDMQKEIIKNILKEENNEAD